MIEVFIRSEEGISRDVVKHLNQIEEQVLESRAWSRDSAMWAALQAAGNRVPTVEEVSRQGWSLNTQRSASSSKVVLTLNLSQVFRTLRLHAKSMGRCKLMLLEETQNTSHSRSSR